VRQPFYLNVAAQAAAVEALGHQDEVERRVERTLAERIALEQRLEALGLRVAESDANFVWVHLPDADDQAEAEAEAAVIAGLRERGVLVRAGVSLGHAGAMRATVGTERENEKFAGALAELI
jgi:histidinol-phosphate aminotransferase